MKLEHVLPLLLAVVPAATLAAPTSKEIDTALQACLAKSEGVTVEAKGCLSGAHQAMDARMNAVYQRLMKQLGQTESASLLRDAQRKWLSYRDAETRFFSAAYPDRGGTTQLVASVDLAYTLAKERTAALERYLQSASDAASP